MQLLQDGGALTPPVNASRFVWPAYTHKREIPSGYELIRPSMIDAEGLSGDYGIGFPLVRELSLVIGFHKAHGIAIPDIR